MTAWIRNPDDLRRAFDNQIKALTSSCAAYDGGEDWEASRIATSIYVLVHDKGKQDQGLITQLGLKGKMDFLASGRPVDPKNLAGDTPLVKMRVGGGRHARFLPFLDEAPAKRAMGFDSWWDRDVIFRNGDDTRKITRKKLTFALRNHEGGAHWDAQIQDPNYTLLAGGAGWVSQHNGEESPVKDAANASMRQVAWELLESLRAEKVI
jgi:hypothetical protein